MAMTARSGGGATRPGRRQPRRGGLVGRFNGAERWYECLVQAFPRLAYAAYLESEAEAVVCISNSKVTWQVVHGLEKRGIPAFGPIWDS
jgi:hypothetical protein